MSSILACRQFYDPSHTLTEDESEEFVDRIWKSSKSFCPYTLSAYLAWVGSERQRADNPPYSNLEFQHIFEVRDTIRRHGDKSRSDLQHLVKDKLSALKISAENLQDIISLVIKLTFMVKVEFRDSRYHPSPYQLQIPEDQTLQATLGEIQRGQPLRDWHTQNELPVWFNVIDLERKANLGIGWTDYISEHLTLQGGNILLFRHVEALKYLEQSDVV